MKNQTSCDENTPDVTELRKKFIAEAKQSEAEYRKSGLYVTLDECLDWLDSWETGHPREAGSSGSPIVRGSDFG